MLQSLTRSWRQYRQNFLRLSIFFCVTAIPIQLLVLYAPRTLTVRIIVPAAFVVSFLVCGGIDVVIVDGFRQGKEVPYRTAWRKVVRRGPELTAFGAGASALGLISLYLVLRFLNFVTALALLALPLFAAFGLPALVLERGGLLETMREVASLSWESAGRVTLFFLLPGIGVVYVWFLGLWLPLWCFVFPLWVSLITNLYLEVRETGGES